MNSLDIEKTLISLGFKEQPNSIKSKKFTIDILEHPVYVKTPSGNSKLNFVSKDPLVIHSEYKPLIHNLSGYFDGIHPNSTTFYHSTSLTDFDKKLHKGRSKIHYGLAITIDTKKALALLMSSLCKDQQPTVPMILNPEISDAFETVKKVLINARVGQGKYRNKLINLWKGCSVTNVTETSFLKASHIIPWVQSNSHEKLDQFNGLLLTPTLDTAFDQGYITFQDDGNILISDLIKHEAVILGILKHYKLRFINPEHIPYLKWHRNHLFKSGC